MKKFRLVVLEALVTLMQAGEIKTDSSFDISTGSADIPVLDGDLDLSVEEVTGKYGFVFSIKNGEQFAVYPDLRCK